LKLKEEEKIKRLNKSTNIVKKALVPEKITKSKEKFTNHVVDKKAKTIKSMTKWKCKKSVLFDKTEGDFLLLELNCGGQKKEERKIRDSSPTKDEGPNAACTKGNSMLNLESSNNGPSEKRDSIKNLAE
jgi:hypothetical protein